MCWHEWITNSGDIRKAYTRDFGLLRPVAALSQPPPPVPPVMAVHDMPWMPRTQPPGNCHRRLLPASRSDRTVSPIRRLRSDARTRFCMVRNRLRSAAFNWRASITRRVRSCVVSGCLASRKALVMTRLICPGRAAVAALAASGLSRRAADQARTSGWWRPRCSGPQPRLECGRAPLPTPPPVQHACGSGRTGRGCWC